MLRVLILIYFLAVIFVGYRRLPIGWLMLIPPFLLVTSVWIGAMSSRPSNVKELSPEANKLLRKYYPHFALPNSFSVYAHASILLWMTALSLAIIGCFRGSWWGIPLAIAAFATMAALANRYNPKYSMKTVEDQLAYHEIGGVVHHTSLVAAEQRAARTGYKATLFGTRWFMSMSDVRRILSYAQPSIDDANVLWHAGGFDGRKVGFSYYFENDSLSKISVYFRDFASTVEDYHHVQAQLSREYCQMSEPSRSDMYSLFSRGEADAFSLEHFLWAHAEGQNGEGMIFMPQSRDARRSAAS